MRYLRWIGLVPCLLIVGVLGGLMAPHPSEALPPTSTTLTLQIDGVGSPVSILTALNTPTTCSAADVTLGYNFCYAINTNATTFYTGAAVGGLPVRRYKIQNASGTTARLRVSDKNGQDKFSLAGVQFVPELTTWGNTSPAFANTKEQHILTVIMKSTFDATSDPTTSTVIDNKAGLYTWALRTGGEFHAGPTTVASCTSTDTKCDSISDAVVFTGKGTFSNLLPNVDILSKTGTKNLTPLSLTVLGPHTPNVSYAGLTNADMGQVDPTYPQFDCKNDYSGGNVLKCTPTITLTMKATLVGPDTFVVLNGTEAYCAKCDATISAQQADQITFLTGLVKVLNFIENNHHNAKLRAFIDEINLILDAAHQTPSDLNCPGAILVKIDMATAATIDAVIIASDGSVPVEPAPPAPETGTFAPATNFGVGINPQSVAIGDLNGDGKPDLAVAESSGSLSLLFGTGGGAFGAATSVPVGTSLRSVAIGDLNGDGTPDLAVANDTGSNVWVLLGTGGGAFGGTLPYGVGSQPVSVAIGDLNGDGKPDLAVANSGGNVSVLLGTGTGSFGAATNFAAGSAPFSVAIGDLNGDGKPDLAVANVGDATVSVLLGTGTGAFGLPTNFPVGSQPQSVAIGDLNGDGKPDLAVANSSSANVSVLLGTGTGSFGAATNFAVVAGSSPFSVAIGDLNGDGKPDLAVADGNSAPVSVLLGTGTGSFGAATNYAVGSAPDSVAIGDLNGDGKPDLAVANYLSNNVSILFNVQP
jgi:VCBS repeat protein/FG-GAP repeat protein